jgi:hypothetical protein
LPFSLAGSLNESGRQSGKFTSPSIVERHDGKAGRNAAASLKFSEISTSPIGRSELAILAMQNGNFVRLSRKKFALAALT